MGDIQEQIKRKKTEEIKIEEEQFKLENTFALDSRFMDAGEEQIEKKEEILAEKLDEKQEEVHELAKEKTGGPLVLDETKKSILDLRMETNDDMKTINKAINSRLEKVFVLDKKEEEKNDIKRLDTEALKSEHKVRTERVLVKKRTFKPDEYEERVIVEKKEDKVADKQETRRLLMQNAGAASDELVASRESIPMEYKKRMDYRTVKELATFSYLFGEGEQLEHQNIVDLYSQGKKEKKQDATFAAMNLLTEKFMAVPVDEIADDEMLAKNAKQYEHMSEMSKAYRSLLDKNPDYFDAMCKKKVEGSNISYGAMIMDKLERMNSVVNYYRMRRIVIGSELYASKANEEIDMNDAPGDDASMKRLKKNMRASYFAGINMKNYMREKGTKLIMPDTAVKQDVLAMYMNTFDYDMEHVTEKELKNRLDYLKNQNKFINNAENDRFTEPALKFKNALSIENLKKDIRRTSNKEDEQERKKEEEELNRDLYNNTHVQPDILNKETYKAIERDGKNERYKIFRKIGAKTVDGSWRGAVNFEKVKGKKDLLSKLEVGDDFARIHSAITGALSEGLTDAELEEMVDLLSKRQQYSDEEWEELDPEAKDYYESAYAEMAMKLIMGTSNATKRMAEAVGKEFIVMHPIDIITQMTPDLKAELHRVAIATNILKPDNMPYMRELFEKYDKDGDYPYNEGEFDECGSVCGTMIFKFEGPAADMAKFISGVADVDYGKDYCDKVRKMLFGSKNALKDVVEPELKKYLSDHPNDVYGPDEKNEEGIARKKAMWYLNRHPELISVKNYSIKIDGKYVFGGSFSNAAGSYLSDEDNKNGQKSFINNKDNLFFSDQELDKYEKSLKDRGVPPLLIKLTKEDIRPAKDGNNELLDEVNKDIEKDPYAVNIVRNKYKVFDRYNEIQMKQYGKLRMAPNSFFKGLD